MSNKNENQFGYGYNPNQPMNNMNMQSNQDEYGHQYEQPYVRNGVSYETPVAHTNSINTTQSSTKVKVIVGSIFAFVGVLFAIIAVIVGITSVKYFKTAESIKAKIYDIETSRDHDGDTTHSVYVSYYYDGEYYQRVKLNSYSSSMYIGKEITVYVDPDNPWDVRMKGSTVILVAVFGGIGTIFSVLGISVLVYVKKCKRKNM